MSRDVIHGLVVNNNTYADVSKLLMGKDGLAYCYLSCMDSALCIPPHIVTIPSNHTELFEWEEA